MTIVRRQGSSLRSLARAAYCLLLVALLSAAAGKGVCDLAGQQGLATLHGRVVADDDPARPIIGARVTIVELHRTTLTDRSGNFRLPDIPTGEYTLRIQLQGFAAYETRTAVSGGSVGMDVALVPTPFELEEVIATASPVGSAVGYQAAQAFGRDALQRRVATSIGEMLDGEPGVAMRSFGGVPARPVLRGLDGDRVLVLENGERMGDLQEMSADHAISADPLATDRIEVVRGPASLLYGSSALSGVVNLFNDDLQRQWTGGNSGSVAFQAATVNRLGAGFGRFQHGGDRWAATGRFSYRDAGNVATPEGALPGTNTASVSGAAGVAFTADDLDGGLSLDLFENEFGIPGGHHAGESVEIRMARRTIQGRAGWRIGGFLEDIDLRFNAARFDQQEFESGHDHDHEEGHEEDHEDAHGSEVALEWRQHTLSSTLTLRNAPLGILDAGAIGLSLFFRDLEVGGEEAFMPNSRSAAVALFTFQEVPVAPGLRLQFGGRVESQRMRPLANEHFLPVGGERTRGNVSGAVGLNLRPTAGLEFGTQLARAHRTPGARELYAEGPDLGSGTYEIGDPDLGTEIGHGVDFFTRWTTDRARLEIAAFLNRIDNFIVFQPTGAIDAESGLAIFHYEGDRAQLFGGEATIETLLTDRLRARLAADYVRGRRRDAASTPLPSMPPLRGRAGLTYTAPRWWIGGDARAVDAQERVAPDEEPTRGYTLLGFDSGYRIDSAGSHLLTLRLDNSLDTAYRDHLSRVEDRHYPMPGRNLNLVYRWLF